MIDAHCHLQDDSFGDDLPLVIDSALSCGIEKFSVNGTSESDWGRVAELSRRYPSVVPSFGLHPWYVAGRGSEWLETLKCFLIEFPDAGVGEIGLDRWVKGHDIDDQIPVFQAQWELAVELNRPITVHCLKGWGHLQAVLRSLPEHRFLLHSYSGSAEMVPFFVERGAYFSVSGYFLKPEKSAKFDVFDHVPADRLLLETDAPAMELPENLDLHIDSEFNHPANLSVVYREVAERRGLAEEVLSNQVAENYSNWFTGSPR